jgi:hypothetical protein
VDELTRRQMLKVTGAAAATIAASLQGPAPTPRPGTGGAATAPWNHDPASPIQRRVPPARARPGNPGRGSSALARCARDLAPEPRRIAWIG